MTIRYAVAIEEALDTRADYALRLLLDGVGVPARRTNAFGDADLVYAPERPAALHDRALWLEATGGDWDVWNGFDLADPPDVVRATYALATGAWERHWPRNAYGVPLGRGGNGELSSPWSLPHVGRYCETLADRLEAASRTPLRREPRWPDGKSYAIVLSHDVDAPFLRAPWSFYANRLALRLSRREPRAAAHGVAQLLKTLNGNRTLRLPEPRDDPNFRFDEWLDVESAVPAASCFYVAVTTSGEAHGAPVDVWYDFRHPDLVAALRRAADRGWEIGLHVSVNARRSSGRVAEERARLESVLAGHEVRGARHHYWALDADVPERTLWEHVAAGLEYDSSLGLNDVPGFRRGLAWPFRPFDREQGAEVPILEIPPTLMDGGIFYRPVAAEEGRELIRAHVADVKRHGGAAVLDWHPEQLNPRRLHGAGAALVSVLPELAADADAHWTTPAALAEWWRGREARLAATS